MALFNLNGFVNVVIGNAMRNLNTVQNQTARTAQSMDASMSRASTAANQMGKAFMAMGAMFTAKLGGEALKKLMDFDDKMRNVNTLAKLGQQDFEKFSDTIANFSASNKLATTATENATALYEIYSANVLRGANATENMAQAQNILKEASMAATGGLTDTKTAVDIMTTVMNTYGNKAGSLRDINDVLFKTVELGKVSYGELAKSMSFVLGQATSSQISFKELSAVMATLTDKGQSSSIAARELRTMIGAITNPSKAAKEAMALYGFRVDQTTLANEGLVATIKKVVEATGGNMDAMKAIFRENTAVTAATLLASDGFVLLDDAVKKLNNNLEGTSLAAYEEKMKSIANQWKAFKVQVESIVLTYGARLIPSLIDATKAMNNLATSINSASPETKDLAITIIKAAGAFVLLLGSLSAVRFIVMSLAPAFQILISPLMGIARALPALISGFKYLAALNIAQFTMWVEALVATAISAATASLAIAGLVAAAAGVAAIMYLNAKAAETEKEMFDQDQKALKNLERAYWDARLSAEEFFNLVKGKDRWIRLSEDLLGVATDISKINTRLKELNSHKEENASMGFDITQEDKDEIQDLERRKKLALIKQKELLQLREDSQKLNDKLYNESQTPEGKEKAAKEKEANRTKAQRNWEGLPVAVRSPVSPEMEILRQKAENDWTEFNRKKQAGIFKSHKEELDSFYNILQLMEKAGMAGELDKNGKIVKLGIGAWNELAQAAGKIEEDARQEIIKETEKDNKQKVENELSRIAELSKAKKISFEQEIILLKKVRDFKGKGVITQDQTNQINEKIAGLKGRIIGRDKANEEAATAKAVATLQHQAKMYEYQARAMDHMIAGMIKQGKTADEINAKLKERLALTMKQIDAEEKAGIRGAKSEEEKAAIKAEADAKRTDATQVYQNKVEEVARKEVDQLNKSDDANRAVNDQKLQALQNQSGWLDRQEKQGKNVSGQRIAILKKENEIIINNIKSETANKLRDRQSEGALSSELAAIEAEGKQKVENILEQQKQTIYDILNAEKERTKNADPRQTLEEAMGDINAQMNSGNSGTSQGVYGQSNLGGPSAFGGPSLFSSSLNDMTGGFIGANPRGPRLNSAPAGVGDRWMQMAKAGSLGGAVKNFSNGGAGYSGDIRQKVAIEIDVNGKLSTVSGKLSTATLNGLFSDATGNARMRGSDGTRNGRQA